MSAGGSGAGCLNIHFHIHLLCLDSYLTSGYSLWVIPCQICMKILDEKQKSNGDGFGCHFSDIQANFGHLGPFSAIFGQFWP